MHRVKQHKYYFLRNCTLSVVFLQFSKAAVNLCVFYLFFFFLIQVGFHPKAAKSCKTNQYATSFLSHCLQLPLLPPTWLGLTLAKKKKKTSTLQMKRTTGFSHLYLCMHNFKGEEERKNAWKQGKTMHSREFGVNRSLSKKSTAEGERRSFLEFVQLKKKTKGRFFYLPTHLAFILWAVTQMNYRSGVSFSWSVRRQEERSGSWQRHQLLWNNTLRRCIMFTVKEGKKKKVWVFCFTHTTACSNHKHRLQQHCF